MDFGLFRTECRDYPRHGGFHIIAVSVKTGSTVAIKVLGK